MAPIPDPTDGTGEVINTQPGPQVIEISGSESSSDSEAEDRNGML